LAPAQTNCNYLTLAFRNLASVLSESVGVGTLGRAAAVLAPDGPNNEGIPASAPANGPSVDHASGRVQGEVGPAVDNNHLHYNPYPFVGSASQPNVCEAGNEPFIKGKAVIGNVPATSRAHDETTRKTDMFGETYPRSTLEALGIPSSKKAKKGKRK
jgi:hypothetical protein